MAIGKQYRLELVPEIEKGSCVGCWFREGSIKLCPKCMLSGKHLCMVANQIWKPIPVNK